MSAQRFVVPQVGGLADVEIVGRHVAAENYCAWPNVTQLRDGTLAAIAYNRPSHAKMEGEVECWTSRDGAAWKKTSKEGGKTFISIRFDSPFLPKPLNSALFPAKEAGRHILDWDRPERKAD